MKSFDNRPTLTRLEARNVYDDFARTEGHGGGSDATSGYGGPAVRALLSMSALSDARTVLDYGCGECKLAESVFTSGERGDENRGQVVDRHSRLRWHGVDQSPKMVQKARERLRPSVAMGNRIRIDLLESGDPWDVMTRLDVKPNSVDRFISTYCLDLLSEQDMYSVLDVAEECLNPKSGLLLLAGITWGYTASIRTFFMTLLWEFLYMFWRKKVGGCRPQKLEPYLIARGWTIVDSVRTLPDGFPWMVSEVIAARPPGYQK